MAESVSSLVELQLELRVLADYLDNIGHAARAALVREAASRLSSPELPSWKSEHEQVLRLWRDSSECPESEATRQLRAAISAALREIERLSSPEGNTPDR